MQFYQPVAEEPNSERFRAPTLVAVQDLARSRTESAINVLSAIMLRETANAFARVAAANAILDRGWGRPVQPLATDHGPMELLHRIERVIVHPDNPSPAVNHIERSDLSQVSQSVSSQEGELR
ncbi:hypothetical protein UB31_38725 [Bradyrhizobium sp. LTSP849]|uniref:hypothetical protein n=2 Tax=unclassified Bradyrhizobium TaxID=2631580 RepID=UPI0005D1D763|nr:hypothetical protein [Bradyrhizobium sp. LTSP849]KJC34149.1 hypothetical protein UB31_38725 [Bradyrhizobium sp. LTSP849]